MSAEPKDTSLLVDLDMDQNIPCVQHAIQASLQDRAFQNTSEAPKRASSSVSKPRNIEDCIAELTKIVPMLRRPQLVEGDTWVFINAPVMESDRFSAHMYHRICQRYSTPLVMKSETFRNLKSTFFDDLFRPTAQFKAVRRRKLVNQLPPGIKYVIDLTPPDEGDEAVILTSNLSCPMGVRLWHLARIRWNISDTLVGGRDEYMEPIRESLPEPEPVPDVAKDDDEEFSNGTTVRTNTTDFGHPTPHKLTIVEEIIQGETGAALLADASGIRPVQEPTIPQSPRKQPPTTENTPVSSSSRRLSKSANETHPPIPIPSEYTPLRHRLAIERILIAISNIDPRLDSAPKVFTTCAVAKYFDIKQSPFTDYVVRWLRAQPNTYFMEVLPEVTLKMADDIQCGPICVDSFSILVGEAVLDLACEAAGISNVNTHLSVHGRKKEELMEKYVTRIQYARLAFEERIKTQIRDMVGMSWIESLSEYRKLPVSSSPDYVKALDDLTVMLKDYVHGAWFTLLVSNYLAMPGPVADNHGGEVLFPTQSFSSTWRRLGHKERVFTRSFYEILKGCNLDTASSNYLVEGGPGYARAADWSDEAKILLQSRQFKIVKAIDVINQIVKCHRIYRRNMYSEHMDSPTIKPTSFPETPDPYPRLRVVNPDPAPSGQSSNKRPHSVVGIDEPVLLPIRAAESSSFVTGRDSGSPVNPPAVHKRSRSETTGEELSTLLIRDKEHAFAANVYDEPFGSIRNDDYLYLPLIRDNQIDGADIDAAFARRYPLLASKKTDSFHGGVNGTSAIAHGQDCSPTSPPALREINAVPQESVSLRDSPPKEWEEELCGYPTNEPEAEKPWSSYEARSNGFFAFSNFLAQATATIHRFAKVMLSSPDSFQRAEPLDLALTNVLVCLNEEELNFLPLWAGGCDDGTNGVFSDDIPLAPAGAGFATAGPRIHVDGSDAGSTLGSEFEDVHSRSGSTIRSSEIVHDGYGDFMDRRIIYAPSEGDSTMDSESTWDRVSTPPATEHDDEEMALAMAIEHSMSPSIATAELESLSIDKGKGKARVTEEENYDDLFQDSDGEEIMQDDDDDEDDDMMIEDESYSNSDFEDIAVSDKEEKQISNKMENEEIQAGPSQTKVVTPKGGKENQAYIVYKPSLDELDAKRP